jgi:2-(1,2-epoxy-1,2-dihydrophenyl)acetyl-CoA isomerase
MIYDTLRVTLENDVAVIALNRPDVMNALNTQMRAELTSAILEMGRAARVVVLTGTGASFCSGQDLGDGSSLAKLDLERTLRDEYEPMLHAIINCPVPTITALNGVAAGAGANLALAADVVIATKSAYFTQAFTKIGLIPDAGGTYFLPRLVGQAKAMGAALFAEKITAEQADAWGMIFEAIEDDAFDAHWRARAAKLATGPSVAYKNIKNALGKTWHNTLEEQLSLEAKLQKECGNTRDFQEGILSFIEKRAPNFEGR